MRITNAQGVHPLIVRAIERQDAQYAASRGSRPFASVTQLLKPPTQVALQRRHRDEMTEEAEGCLYRLFGTALHNVLSTGGEDANALSEERLTCRIAGELISGGFDSVVELTRNQDEMWLSDFKLTSVWTAKRESTRADYAAQTNIYAYMLEQAGFGIGRITTEVILRDWSRSRAHERGYPKHNWLRIPIAIWPPEQVVAFVTGKVEALKEVFPLSDVELPICADRWGVPDKWAVMKKRAKRATKLHETEGSAQEHVDFLNEHKAKGHYVEHRPGDAWRRCRDYCTAAPFCPYWLEVQGAQNTAAP